MILKYSAAVALSLAVAILAMRGWPARPEKATAAVAAQVLAAVAQGDYEAFLAQADRGLRRMRLEDFRSLSGQHAPRLRKGHELHPLDDRQRGAVHLSRWKLVFKDGSPDAVLTLGMKDGKVATFALY